MDHALRQRLYAYPDVDRPWVRANFVSTLDGSATGTDGTSSTLGGSVDRELYLYLRSICDVVVVGAGTTRTERYGPIPLNDDDIQWRLAGGLAPKPILAVVSSRLDIPDRLRLPEVVTITTETAAAEHDLGPMPVIAAGSTEIDWRGVLSEFARRGWHRVLCEGGPHLFASLAELDLVDDVCLTIAPSLALGDGPRITSGASTIDRPMVLAHAQPVDNVLLVRWVKAEA